MSIPTWLWENDKKIGEEIRGRIEGWLKPKPDSVFGRIIEETKHSPPDPIPLDPNVKPEDYDKKIGCVRYAQNRRKRPHDLGKAGGDGGAANYIEQHKDKVFQISNDDTDLQDRIAKGYALVWPRGVLGPTNDGRGGQYGHVAIVEEVGPDYVIVSQAGWGDKTTMKISRSDFEKWNLYVIP